jgi:hypothetical protein
MALLALFRKRARPWVYAAALLSIPFALNAGTRFLIPALAFAILGLAAVLPARALIAVACLHAVLSWPAALDRFTPDWSWRIREVPLRAALRLESPAEYAARHVDGISLVSALDRAKGQVLALSQFHDSYTAARLLTAPASRHTRDLGEAIWRASTAAEHSLVSRVRYWFPTAEVRGLRLISGGEPVGIARVSAYDLLKPVELRGWNATATWNRSTTHNALDGSILTQWHSATRSGEPVAFEITFPAGQVMNRLDVDIASVERLPAMRLEGLRAKDGRWIALRAGWDQVADPIPPADIRTAALDVLRRQNVEYVLIQNGDHKHDVKPFDAPFETDRYRYERTAEAGPARLYRIVPKVAVRVANP